MKRAYLSRKGSRRMFRNGIGVRSKNVIGRPMRGGIRL